MAESERLNLIRDRPQGARLATAIQSPHDLDRIVQTGELSLGHTHDERRLWEHLLEDDLLLCLTTLDPMRAVATRVVGKGIVQAQPRTPKPFALGLEILGTTVAFKVRLDRMFFDDFVFNVGHSAFQETWDQCRRTTTQQGRKAPEPLSTNGRLAVRLASSRKDHQFIAEASRRHPFGYRRAFLTLMCVEEKAPVGALLANLSIDSDRVHRRAEQIFRSWLPWVRRNGVCVARIYEQADGPSKWRIHHALLRAAIQLAPHLVEETLSVIEGVSYDYHPLAPRLGFHVEVPRRLEGSFYYWKALNVPGTPFDYSPEQPHLRARVSALNAQREKARYWLAPGRSRDIALAIERQAWAVRQSPTNTGRWRSLRKGDHMFLRSQAQVVEAIGRVSRTGMRRVDEYRNFPLGIEFAEDTLQRVEIDVAYTASAAWLDQSETSGLMLLPPEVGSELMELAESQLSGGQMWVTPNPYLLHKREFHVVPGQIFVVQAWDLQTTVLPLLRGILQEHGYAAVSAADREGQLVFDDIWRLLNESEAVIVDFTKQRPNVYLEYGMALVLGKPVVAITQDKKDIPSDTSNLKYILYQDALVGRETLLSRLPRSLADVIADVQELQRHQSPPSKRSSAPRSAR